MDADTQRFAHRVGIMLVAAMIGAAFIYMMVIGIMQGDGEATRLAASLQPYVLGALGGLLGLLGVNSVVSGLVAMKTGTQIPLPSGSAVPAVSVPATAATADTSATAIFGAAPTGEGAI